MWTLKSVFKEYLFRQQSQFLNLKFYIIICLFVCVGVYVYSMHMYMYMCVVYVYVCMYMYIACSGSTPCGKHMVLFCIFYLISIFFF